LAVRLCALPLPLRALHTDAELWLWACKSHARCVVRAPRHALAGLEFQPDGSVTAMLSEEGERVPFVRWQGEGCMARFAALPACAAEA
jgi:hypothetical protein